MTGYTKQQQLVMNRRETDQISYIITELGPPAKQKSSAMNSQLPMYNNHLIYKLHCFFPLDASNGGYLLVVKKYAIKFISRYKHFWAERCCDELGSRSQRLNHS